MKTYRRGYSCFEQVSEWLKNGRWLDNDQTVEYTQDTEKGLLCVQPAHFVYSESRVVRVAEFDAE